MHSPSLFTTQRSLKIRKRESHSNKTGNLGRGTFCLPCFALIQLRMTFQKWHRFGRKVTHLSREQAWQKIGDQSIFLAFLPPPSESFKAKIFVGTKKRPSPTFPFASYAAFAFGLDKKGKKVKGDISYGREFPIDPLLLLLLCVLQ